MFTMLLCLFFVGVAEITSALNVAINYTFLVNSPSALQRDILIGLVSNLYNFYKCLNADETYKTVLIRSTNYSN